MVNKKCMFYCKNNCLLASDGEWGLWRRDGWIWHCFNMKILFMASIWVYSVMIWVRKIWLVSFERSKLQVLKIYPGLIDWVRLNVPATQYRSYHSYGDGFLRVKWPNQQCQSTEGTDISGKNMSYIRWTRQYTCMMVERTTTYTPWMYYANMPCWAACRKPWVNAIDWACWLCYSLCAPNCFAPLHPSTVQRKHQRLRYIVWAIKTQQLIFDSNCQILIDYNYFCTAVAGKWCEQ